MKWTPRIRISALIRLLQLSLCTLSLTAQATTTAEQERKQAPMPHETLSPHAAMVKVHLVSSLSYLEGAAGNAANLSRLRDQVARCVRRNRERGVPAKPPSAWPDHLISARTDTYEAINRAISYTHAISYQINQLDCSLLEIRSHTADLHSSIGGCNIDLLAKTARGTCDASGHAHAKPPVRLPLLTAAQLADVERAAASNPAMAAFAAAVHRHQSRASGERKTILGLECEVSPNPLDPDGEVCASLGGSFTSVDSADERMQSGLVLETTSHVGVITQASMAKLDTLVSDAVFAPYLSAGYTFIAARRRP